jgi:RND family efflux transporter MFP subunit
MNPTPPDPAALLRQLRIEREDKTSGSSAGAGGGRSLRWIGVALLVLVAIAVAAWALLKPAAVEVQAVTVQPVAGGVAKGAGGAGSVLDASGYVVARRAATVSAKITGKVVQVLIDEGLSVKAGEVVARLDDTNTRAAYELALAQRAYVQAGLAQLRVSLANAERDLQRKRDLAAQQMVSRSDLDNALTNVDSLHAQIATQQSNVEVSGRELEVAQRNLDDTVVRAPFDGMITAKSAQQGEIVSPISAGGGFTRTGIGTIVDMHSLEVEVDVNENFIDRVRPTQKVSVRLNAYPDWNIPAQVIAIIPTADRSKGTVKVRIGFDRADPAKALDSRILPEMGVRVSFLDAAPAPGAPGAARAVAAVSVPRQAVLGSGDTGTVFVIHGDTVERRAVRLGGAESDPVQVLSGLSAGEQLALGDLSKLNDGSRVRVVPGASSPS